MLPMGSLGSKGPGAGGIGGWGRGHATGAGGISEGFLKFFIITQLRVAPPAWGV